MSNSSPDPASTDAGPTETVWQGGQQHFRWDVKTGSDPAVSSIAAGSPTSTTIAELTSQPVPEVVRAGGERPPGPGRTAGVESTIWALGDVTLLRYHQESDHDYHLVLGDADGQTMIAEIPDPQLVDPTSPFLDQITSARAAFESHFQPQLAAIALETIAATGPQIMQAGEPVQVTGIGFFDFVHRQDGVAQNGVELHPVLSITFQASST